MLRRISLRTVALYIHPTSFLYRRAHPRLPCPRGPERSPVAVEELRDGSNEAIICTSRGKSSGPPGVGSAHTSTSRKSWVSSWIRQGREVCALFGSRILEPPSIR